LLRSGDRHIIFSASPPPTQRYIYCIILRSVLCWRRLQTVWGMSNHLPAIQCYLYPHGRRPVWGPALSYLPHQTLFSKCTSQSIELVNVLNHDYCFPVLHYFSHCTFLAKLDGSSDNPACRVYSSVLLHFVEMSCFLSQTCLTLLGT